MLPIERNENGARATREFHGIEFIGVTIARNASAMPGNSESSSLFARHN